MGKYRSLGNFFDRVFRNDLNSNFDDIDKDLSNTQKQVNKLVVEGDSSPQAIQASIGADGTDYNGNLKARLDAEYKITTAQLATMMTQTEFDSWVATLLDGGPSIFTETYNQLVSTYPNGAAGVALVRETDPSRIYVWNPIENSWQDYGDYQGLEPKDESITNQKLDVNLQEIIGATNAIIFKKNIVNPYKIITKPTAGTESMIEFIFDTNGFTLPNSSAMKLDLKYFVGNQNINRLRVYIAQNNSLTQGDISGKLTNQNIASSPIYNEEIDVNLAYTSGTYETQYRYVHVLIAANFVDTALLSEFYLSNLRFFIEGIELTTIISVGGYRHSSLGSITKDLWYEPFADILNKNTILNDIDELNNKTNGYDEEIYIKKIDRPYQITARPSTGAELFVEFIFDTNSLGLESLNIFDLFLKYYTNDTNINRIRTFIYQNNSSTPSDLSGVSSSILLSEPPLYGEIVEKNVKFGSYDSQYRYLHVLIGATVTDTTVMSTFYVSNLELYVGDIRVINSIHIGKHRITTASTVSEDTWFEPLSELTNKSSIKDELKRVSNQVKHSNQASSRFYGGKANFLGDSITDETHSAASKKYWSYVGDTLDLEVRPYGISSSTISNATNHNPMVDRYVQMDDDADLIVVFAGTNDYGHSTATKGTLFNEDGTVNKDTLTFYGACAYLFEGLIKKYLNRGAEIVIMTPIPRQGKTTPNITTGETLDWYVDVIKEVAQYYSLPVLDLFRTSSLQSNIPEVKTKYVPDGTHPNNSGHAIIANRLLGFLSTL